MINPLIRFLKEVSPYMAHANQNVLFLAVLPSYRSECIEIVRGVATDDVRLFVSEAHLDPSVKTGIPIDWFTRVSLIRLFGRRAFIQIIPTLEPILAKSLILDLNPRSLTSWFLLVVRRMLRRRTLVWGHINPQRGSSAKTVSLRLAMRKLSSGTICYTYSDRKSALTSLPNSPVWVAPNSLYKAAAIRCGTKVANRSNILYVGRFEPAKKVPLLVRAFAMAMKAKPELRLVLVGGGSEETILKKLVQSLDIEKYVHFAGWIDQPNILEGFYDLAFCTVSPGFAGLGLTQSLGFGVPVVVADEEPHSPEIELADSGGVSWFSSDSSTSLSAALLEQWESREHVPVDELSAHVRSFYSAESMARGLSNALNNVPGN